MTATKAFAATVAAELVIIASWAITLIPGWAVVPMNVQAAATAIVAGAIGFYITYAAPANVVIKQGE